jgi:PTS system cellobiose-specific IIB component
MIKYAASKGIEADVDALPFDKVGDRINRTDILLIGPQVRHLLKKVQAEYGDKIPVIQVMSMSDYALMKAGEIFDGAFAEYTKKTTR